MFETDRVTIKRIVANGFQRPSGFWYDQAEDESVIVLRGKATVEFEDGNVVQTKEGDYCTPREYVRQRIQQTDRDTIWLAIHVQPGK